MKKLFGHFLILSILWSAMGCSDDPVIEDKGIYNTGIFIVNEGNFGSGSGTIDFINRVADTLVSDIYMKANNVPLGNIGQSLFFHGDRGYIMVNNGAKIEVVNADDFTSVSTIHNISQVRNMTNVGNKLFVTSWGDGFTGAVSIIDAESNTVELSKTFDNGPEAIFFDNDKLYVSRSGGYGRDSVIMVLNPNDLSLINEIEVGDIPTSIVKDANNALWVLCSGYTDWTNPEKSTKGALVKIVNDVVVETSDISTGSSDLVIDNSGLNLYYLSKGVIPAIARRNIGSFLPLVELLVLHNGYSLGIDPKTNNLYLGDATPFGSRGHVLVYDNIGNPINEFECGIFPGSFSFR